VKKWTPVEKEEIEKKFVDYMQKNRETLIGEFIKALWRGVGTLDETAARKVYKEVNKVCGGKIFGTVLLGEIMGYDLSEPMDLETVNEILETSNNVFNDGCGKVMTKGNVALECSNPQKCVCPWIQFYGILDYNENQCKYCEAEAWTAWYQLMLKRPVEVSKIFGVAHGGSCGHWKIEVK
jgi:hypothetical protein